MNYDKVASELRFAVITYANLWAYDMDDALDELVHRSARYLVAGTCVPVLVAEELLRSLCNKLISRAGRLMEEVADDVCEDIIHAHTAWLCRADEIFNPCDDDLPPF